MNNIKKVKKIKLKTQKMKSLKKKLCLKVSIPKSNEEKKQSNNEYNNSTIDCSHIIENIFISSYKVTLDYSFLISNNFTHIINCASGSKTFYPLYYKDFKYYNIELRDDGNINIMDSIIKFITFLNEISFDKNNKILIHCSEGISRAPTLVSAYLMWKFNMDSDTAINFVKQKRNCIDINFGFFLQLRNLHMNHTILKGN